MNDSSKSDLQARARANERSEGDTVLRMLLPRRALQWVGAALTFALVGGAGAFAVAASGLVPMSAVPPDPDGVAHLLHYGMTRSVAFHAKAPPAYAPLSSDAMVTQGAANYAVECANCHGAPGFGQSPIALSTRPEPPPLIDVSKSLSDDELFVIVRDGVRYTGMPAWPVLNRPDEVWAVVAFLKAMPGMTRDAYTQLAYGNTQGGRTDPATSVFGPPRPSDPTSTSGISRFIPTNQARPYMPGDPQNPYATPAGTVLPRTGYGSLAGSTDALARCISCHGADGSGRAAGAFPNLTLQSPQYLYDALKAFSTGQRQSGIMWPIAANLTDEEMRAVASRIGSAPAVPSHAGSVADAAAAVVRGQQIALAGLAPNGSPQAQIKGAQDIPPSKVERCSGCHMADKYLDKVIPLIDGQHAAYLSAQLRVFRDGGRGDTAGFDPMISASHNLSDADIIAVSAFYASLAPSSKNAKIQ
jgi:cytochrome c553